MRYMICFAPKQRSENVQTEYHNKFEEAVIRYTVLCNNCEDVVLADTLEGKIMRHYSFRHSANGVSIANY